jgi:hypothetical protein
MHITIEQVRQKLTELQKEIDKSTIRVGNLNIAFLITIDIGFK